MVREGDAGSPIDAPGTGEETWDGWPGLGTFPVADISRWRSAVILAAHPDDEILGAGGVIAALAAARARLRLVAVTDGEASHPGNPAPGKLAARRTAETAAALRVLGAEVALVFPRRHRDPLGAGRPGATDTRHLGAQAAGNRMFPYPAQPARRHGTRAPARNRRAFHARRGGVFAVNRR